MDNNKIMKNFLQNSIYDNLDNKENLVTSFWEDCKKKFNDGLSCSKNWLTFKDEEDLDLKRKEELSFALIQICRTVNIIRTKFGVGKSKSLRVQWASKSNQINTLDDDFVYLSPSPLLKKSDLNLHQKYDVVIGQAFLCSVQKHIISTKLFYFVNTLKDLNDSIPNLVVDIKFDNGNIYFKNNQDIIVFWTDIVESFNNREKFFKDIDCLHYDGNKDFYLYPQIVLSDFLEWHNIWRAIEQNICEKAISNEYKGSISYLFAHRNFYLNKKFDSILEDVVKFYDLEWIPKIWHLLVINNILSINKITNVHPVYQNILELADKILIHDPFQTSEKRLASVIHLICKVSEFIDKLKTQEISISTPNSIPDSLKKKFSKLSSNISNTGIGEAIAKSSDIVEKSTHKKYVQKIPPLTVGDEKSLKLFEFEYLSSNLEVFDLSNHIRNDFLTEKRYKEIALKNSKYIEFLKENLSMRSYQLSGDDFSLKSGMLDENNLWKLACKDEESESVFYQKFLTEKSDNINLNIVFDNSASMDNCGNSKIPRIVSCNILAVILNELTANLPNSKLNFYSFAGDKFYIFKNNRYAVCNQYAHGGTKEEQAILKAACFIENDLEVSEQDKFFKKYLIFVGDGFVNPTKVKSSLEKLKEHTNIRFFHIGLDNSYGKEFGEHVYGKGNFAIVQSENLIKNLCSVIVKILS